MDIEIQSDESVSTDHVTITVREIVDEQENQTKRPSRSSFRSMMTEPVSHFRKRKWASSRHNSPPPKRAEITCMDDDSRAATGSDKSPSPDQDRRRHSSAADRFVDTLKKLLRKDSQQVESPVQERRHISPDQDEYDQTAADGLLKLPNVSGYFNRLGEQGPSNYYETDRWAVFQSPKEPDTEMQGDLQSPDRRLSAVQTPTSHKPPETSMAVVDVSPKRQKSSRRGASSALASPESPSRRKDIFRRRPRRLSKNALGKQPKVTAESVQLHRNVCPAKITGAEQRWPTTLPMTIDVRKPKYGGPAAPSPSSHCSLQSDFWDGSCGEFSTPYPRYIQDSPEQQYHNTTTNKINYNCPTSSAVPRHPQPQLSRTHRVLAARTDTDAQYLEDQASHYNHTLHSSPLPHHSTSYTRGFNDLINNRPQLSPTHYSHHDSVPIETTPIPSSTRSLEPRVYNPPRPHSNPAPKQPQYPHHALPKV